MLLIITVCNYALWLTVNKLLQPRQQQATDKLSADDFAKFFRSKVDNIRTSTDCVSQSACRHCLPIAASKLFRTCNARRDSQTDEQHQQSHVSWIQSPCLVAEASLWSHCTSHLSHYETCPWNLAYFCHCSRKTNLNPDDTSSYRPMSYLPYISKLIERVVTKIFTAHSDTYNLLPVYQSAYMPSHFTETAVPSVHNDLVRAADNGQYCLSFCWTSARLLTL